MFENMLEIGIAEWEAEHLEGKPAWPYRAGLVRSEGKKPLLADMAAVGSRVLIGLGSALVSAGKRLRQKNIQAGCHGLIGTRL